MRVCIGVFVRACAYFACMHASMVRMLPTFTIVLVCIRVDVPPHEPRSHLCVLIYLYNSQLLHIDCADVIYFREHVL